MPGGVAALVGSFGARLGLDTSDYTRGILNANAVTQVFGERFATFVSNPLLGSIQLFKDAGRAALGWASEVLDTAESVSLFATEIGASVEFVQALKAQYEAAGKSFEASKPVFKEIIENIREARRAGSDASRTLDQMGVSLDGVTDSGDALSRIVNGLSQVANEQDRLNLAMDVLGSRGGRELVAVIGATNGAIDEMIERARSLGLVMNQDTVRAVNRVDDAMDGLQQALKGIQQTWVSEFLAGFAGVDGDNSAENIQTIASSVRNELAPAMKDMGAASRDLIELLRVLAPMVGPLTEFLRMGGTNLQLMANALSGDKAKLAATYLGDMAANGGVSSTGIETGAIGAAQSAPGAISRAAGRAHNSYGAAFGGFVGRWGTWFVRGGD